MEQVGVTSSQSLLQRIGQTFNINNSNWHADGLDFIGQAIGLIGYHVGFDYKPIKIKVKSFRGVLPSNLNSIDKVEYCGTRLLLGVDNSSYEYSKFEGHSKNNILTSLEAQELSKEVDRLNALREMDLTDDVTNAIDDAVFKINRIVGTAKLASGHASDYGLDFYNLENGFIKPSFCDGEVIVTGNFLKVDDDGYPLLVNTEKYKKAIEWYVMSILLLRGYKHPVITYQYADGQWEDVWKPRAQNEPKMPSIDKLERFTNVWNSVKRNSQLTKI